VGAATVLPRLHRYKQIQRDAEHGSNVPGALGDSQGKIVAEQYAENLGIGPSSRLISWSVAKSISTALLGLRIGDGVINLTDIAQSPTWSAKEAASRNITSAFPPGGAGGEKGWPGALLPVPIARGGGEVGESVIREGHCFYQRVLFKFESILEVCPFSAGSSPGRGKVWSTSLF
jgi:hypothetical protein